MAKPKLKKESKRMTCRKRYKIEKKVREHNRKVRKEDKLNANKKKKSKDPGIPNLYPFKEQLLKQIQEKKEKEADEKAKRKEQKQKQATRKRKLQDLQKDAEKRAKLFEKRQENEVIQNKEFTKGPVEDSKKNVLQRIQESCGGIGRCDRGVGCPRPTRLSLSTARGTDLGFW